jgi:hypothetical protein
MTEQTDSHTWVLTDVKTKVWDRMVEVTVLNEVRVESEPFELCGNEFSLYVRMRKESKDAEVLIGVFLLSTNKQPFDCAAEIYTDQRLLVEWTKSKMPSTGYGTVSSWSLPRLQKIVFNENQLIISVVLSSSESTIQTKENPIRPFLTLDSALFSDITIKTIDSNEIKAHLFILANRSSVFLAMFTHEMKEAKESVVEVKQTELVMKILVEYIYTGRIQETNIKSMKDALDVFEAAMFYDVEQVAIQVINVVKKYLTAANVFAVIKVSAKHKPHKAAVNLFHAAKFCVQNNLNEFMLLLES